MGVLYSWGVQGLILKIFESDLCEDPLRLGYVRPYRVSISSLGGGPFYCQIYVP